MTSNYEELVALREQIVKLEGENERLRQVNLERWKELDLRGDRISELERRETREYDCRMVGKVAEMSGRHCPWYDPCQRCQLEDAEAERDKLAHTNLIITLEWKQELDSYRQLLKDFAEGNCSYGDGCPDTGTRHGQCISCKAKESLNKFVNLTETPTEEISCSDVLNIIENDYKTTVEALYKIATWGTCHGITSPEMERVAKEALSKIITVIKS